MFLQKNLPPISSVLKQSWLFFQSTLTYCIPLNFLLGVFGLLPMMFIEELQNPPTPEVFQKGIQIFLPYFPLYISGLVIFNAAIFYRLGYLMQNKLVPLSQTYLFVFKRLFSLLGATFLFGIMVGIGLMALFFPGLIFAAYLMFYQPLVLFANARMFEAIDKSYLLVKGKLSYAIVVGTVAMLIVPFWSTLLEMISDVVQLQLPIELIFIIEILLNTFLASFFHCTILVLYGVFIAHAQMRIADSFVA
jgi:hypothetical protein